MVFKGHRYFMYAFCVFNAFKRKNSIANCGAFGRYLAVDFFYKALQYIAGTNFGKGCCAVFEHVLNNLRPANRPCKLCY